MAELRNILSQNGFHDPQTYIQSGNLVLKSEQNKEDIRTKIVALVNGAFGFQTEILVVSGSDFAAVVNTCPFSMTDHDPGRVHVFFHLADLSANDIPTDLPDDPSRLVVTDKALFLHTPDGLSQSKLAELVTRRVGRNTTARNMKTCQKIMQMIAQ